MPECKLLGGVPPRRKSLRSRVGRKRKDRSREKRAQQVEEGKRRGIDQQIEENIETQNEVRVEVSDDIEQNIPESSSQAPPQIVIENSPSSSEPASFSPVLVSSPVVPEPVFQNVNLRKKALLRNLFPTVDSASETEGSSVNSSLLRPNESDSDRSAYIDEQTRQFSQEANALIEKEGKLRSILSEKELSDFATRLNFSRGIEALPHVVKSDDIERMTLSSENIRNFIQYGSKTLKNAERTLILAACVNENYDESSQKNMARMLGVSPKKIEEAMIVRRNIVNHEKLRNHPKAGQITLASMETIQRLHALAIEHSWIFPGHNSFGSIIFNIFNFFCRH